MKIEEYYSFTSNTTNYISIYCKKLILKINRNSEFILKFNQTRGKNGQEKIIFMIKNSSSLKAQPDNIILLLHLF